MKMMIAWLSVMTALVADPAFGQNGSTWNCGNGPNAR